MAGKSGKKKPLIKRRGIGRWSATPRKDWFHNCSQYVKGGARKGTAGPSCYTLEGKLKRRGELEGISPIIERKFRRGAGRAY